MSIAKQFLNVYIPLKKLLLAVQECNRNIITMAMSKDRAPKRKAATSAEKEIKRAKGEVNLFNLKWYEHGEPLSKGIIPLVYLYDHTLPGCSKIASFDMDSTLINVKSGAKFPKGISRRKRKDIRFSLLIVYLKMY